LFTTHTYIHTVEMKSNSLNKSPNGWMGCFFMSDHHHLKFKILYTIQNSIRR
jgi:hypothetical protein